MQTLAPGRTVLVAASLVLLAGCAHHDTVQYPPSDAFFNNPPPQGTLTPAQTGPEDRPAPRKAAVPAATTPAAATTSGAPAKATKSAMTGGAASSAAAGAASATGAATGAAAPAGVAAAAGAGAAAAVAAKPGSVAHDSTAAPATSGQPAHVDELPVAITRVPPQYPDAARAAGIQGTVQLEAFVKTDGTVGNVRVDVSVPGLDEAAMAAVRQWTFKPGMAGGKPVEAWVGVPVKFTIH